MRRASILVDSVPPRFAPPFRRAPHLGHGATQLGLGSGYDREEGWFHELSFRLALHDLVDPATGYPEYAAIEFLPLRDHTAAALSACAAVVAGVAVLFLLNAG